MHAVIDIAPSYEASSRCDKCILDVIIFYSYMGDGETPWGTACRGDLCHVLGSIWVNMKFETQIHIVACSHDFLPAVTVALRMRTLCHIQSQLLDQTHTYSRNLSRATL